MSYEECVSFLKRKKFVQINMGEKTIDLSQYKEMMMRGFLDPKQCLGNKSWGVIDKMRAAFGFYVIF